MLDEIDRVILEAIPAPPYRIATPKLGELVRSAGHPLDSRAIQKRLAKLETLHRLVRHDESKPHQWSWAQGERERYVKPMPAHEVLSVLLAREHLRSFLPPPSLEWVERQVKLGEKQLEADLTGRSKAWRSKVRRVPHGVPREAPEVSTPVFKAVSEALYEGLKLEIDYKKRFSSSPDEYVLEPMGLLERDGELWLVARKDGDTSGTTSTRFFLLHRMKRAKALRGQPVSKVSSAALEAAINEGRAHFLIDTAPPIALVARFESGVVEKLAESRLSKDQSLEQIDETWWRLRATVPLTRALQAFLLGYGRHCVIEEPASLREAVGAELRAAAGHYATHDLP